jgi:hypothetical protein
MDQRSIKSHQATGKLALDPYHYTLSLLQRSQELALLDESHLHIIYQQFRDLLREWIIKYCQGNRNINTSRTPLAGITPSESLEAPYLNTSSLGAWGYVYQLGSQTVAVGSNVTFTDNGPLNGIVHMPGGPTIEVTMDGVYKIEFAVYTSQNNPQDWAVVINGVARARFNSAGQTLVAATILNLNAQDRVTIRNVNTIPDPARLREGDVISAYVLIYKLDS